MQAAEEFNNELQALRSQTPVVIETKAQTEAWGLASLAPSSTQILSPLPPASSSVNHACVTCCRISPTPQKVRWFVALKLGQRGAAENSL